MSSRRGRRLLAGVFVPLLFAVAVPARAGAHRVVLGWNDVGSTETYIARDARAPGLNTVSPGWWLLGKDASIRDTGDRRLSGWAHARGLRVWPLFSNNNDQDTSHRVLTDAALRHAVIARVAALARSEGADGVNVDWEDLRTADRDSFSAFLREAAVVWRAAGLVVSVDVTARTDTWTLGDWSESFDRGALASAADFVVLMAYDEHNRLRPVGSTASLPWVTDSVRYLLRDVPASKVILGVPFYTQDWSPDPRRRMNVLTLAQTPARLRAYRATVRWDDVAGQSVATYVRSGFVHHVWVEDARSVALKAALVRDYELAGVAAWRIGFETPAAWRALASPPDRPSTTATSPLMSATPAPALAVVPSPMARRSVDATVTRARPRSVWTAGAIAAVLIAAVGASALVVRRRRSGGSQSASSR